MFKPFIKLKLNSFLNFIIVVIVYIYCIDVASSNSSSSNSFKPILKFRKDKTFKILQLTDLHYGEAAEWDLLNTVSEESLVANELPDLVILSGDMISGYTAMFDNITNYYTVWDDLTLPMRKRNIPWAVTYGNHDDEGRFSRAQLNKLDMSYNLSLTQDGPTNVSGVANYVLEIKASDSDELAALVYVFDSDKTSVCRGMGSQWGCVDNTQVKWYESMSDKYNKHPGFAFVHVPPYEVVDLWNTKSVAGDFGEKFACCFYPQQGLVKSMVERGDIKSLYFGHDHKNDYHGDYFGLDLGYGRKSGYGSYDPKYTQGARVLKIYEKTLTHDTWIRTMKGEIDNQDTHPALDQIPSYCCVGADSKDEVSWAIYFVLFTVIMAIMFFINWRLFGKKSEYTKIMMQESEKKPGSAIIL